MKHRFVSRKYLLLISLLLLSAIAVSATVAYLFHSTGPLRNLFSGSVVTCAVVENDTEPISGDQLSVSKKENVKIRNTGDTTAYIRVAIVATWKSTDGTRVYAEKPLPGSDYTVTFAADSGWELSGDGFYYYTSPVEPDADTGVLMESCIPIPQAAPEGYTLSIEIVASAIQSSPSGTVLREWSSGISGMDGDTLIIRKGAD